MWGGCAGATATGVVDVRVFVVVLFSWGLSEVVFGTVRQHIQVLFLSHTASLSLLFRPVHGKCRVLPQVAQSARGLFRLIFCLQVAQVSLSLLSPVFEGWAAVVGRFC